MLHILAFAGLLAPAPAVPDTLLFSGRLGDLRVEVPRIDDVEIDIDGRLDDPAWADAAVMRDFTQYEPVEGIDASEGTEVRVLYSQDAIYFGIRAFDSDPASILARLGERDRVVFNDDWVRIMLDTFDDQRQAYVFYVNPLGLQTDGLWIEGLRRGGGGGGGGGGVSIDFNPDFIWESDGRVDELGWAAEMRIPYVSLRFREVPVQDWGIQVAREVKRRGFKQSWAPLTKNVSSTLAQSGKLVGLRDLHPKRLVEIKPVVTGRRTGTIEDPGGFRRSDPEADFGVDGRLGVTQNLVLDATYNPDFSQVEADANQISVNERFALFFPEKRTFFLEGAEIFNTPSRLVYTRSIIDPIAGAKLTGKVGDFQIGYIGAVDESPRSILDASGSAVFNLVRARRDVGSASTVGALFTDRSLTDGSGAYNRVLAGDARFVFGGRYTLTSQVAGSSTRTGSDADDTALRPLLNLAVSRSGRTFAWEANLEDVHPDFRARSGFVQRVGDASLDASVSFTRFGAPGALLESSSLRIVTGNFFTHEGLWGGERPFEHEIELWPTFSFRGDRSVTFVLRNGYFRFEPEVYAEYGVLGMDGIPAPFALPTSLKNMLALGVLPRARLTNKANLNGRLFLREIPIFNEAARGFEFQIAPDLQLRPTTSLQASFNYTYSRIWRSAEPEVIRAGTGEALDGTVYSTVNISRLKLQYQFSRGLLARGIVQYDLQERDRLTDPTTGLPLTVGSSLVDARDGGDFQGQFLLQFEPSPGTIFYVGYSRLMESDEPTYRYSRFEPVEDGLFVKLSYLFRK